MRVVADPGAEPGTASPRSIGEAGEVAWIEVEGLPRLEWSPAGLRCLDAVPEEAGSRLTRLIRAVADATGLQVVTDQPLHAGEVLAVSPEILEAASRQQAENEAREAEDFALPDPFDPTPRPG